MLEQTATNERLQQLSAAVERKATTEQLKELKAIVEQKVTNERIQQSVKQWTVYSSASRTVAPCGSAAECDILAA